MIIIMSVLLHGGSWGLVKPGVIPNRERKKEINEDLWEELKISSHWSLKSLNSSNAYVKVCVIQRSLIHQYFYSEFALNFMLTIPKC
jgi:hypothetical protein